MYLLVWSVRLEETPIAPNRDEQVRSIIHISRTDVPTHIQRLFDDHKPNLTYSMWNSSDNQRETVFESVVPGIFSNNRLSIVQEKKTRYRTDNNHANNDRNR